MRRWPTRAELGRRVACAGLRVIVLRALLLIALASPVAADVDPDAPLPASDASIDPIEIHDAVDVVAGLPPHVLTVYVRASYADDAHMPAVEATRAAAQRWATVCRRADGSPLLRIDWVDDPSRVPDAAAIARWRAEDPSRWRASAVVERDASAAPSRHRAVQQSDWRPDGRAIVLYARCPSDGDFGLPCVGDRPGQPIRWRAPTMRDWVENSLAHEFGHVFGLAHDDPSTTKRISVMTPSLRIGDHGLLPITEAQCRQVDRWFTEEP